MHTHIRAHIYTQEVISTEIELEQSFVAIDQKFRVCREFGHDVLEADHTYFMTMRMEWSKVQQKSSRANERLRKVQEGFKKDLIKAVTNFRTEVYLRVHVACAHVCMCVCMYLCMI
jgi:hypothetical protein